MTAGRRNHGIDVLRGVSILLVLLHHYSIGYHLTTTPLGTLLTPGVVRAVVRNGNYGVTIFFVISGFLITTNAIQRWGSLDRVRARAFYALRIARIMPCLLLLLAIVALLAGAGLEIFQTHPGDDGRIVSPPLVYLAALTFWMNVLIERHGWVNYALGVLWSLSVEEVFYLSFPILCLVLRRPVFIAATWVTVTVAAPFWRLSHQDGEGGFLFAFPAAADGIAIGCLAALLALWTGAGSGIPRSLRIVVMAAMAALYGSASIGQTNVWGVSVMAIGAAILLLPAASARPAAPAAITRPIAWMGRLSYELYLFHLIVLGILRTIWPPKTTGGDLALGLLLVFLALSALLAGTIGRFFAEPANRAIRRALLPVSAQPS